MIHYHGTPIWGHSGEVHRIAVTGAGAFVSFARPDQMAASLRYANKVAIDNGAFSHWKRGLSLDWQKFYTWLMPYYFHEKVSFFVIPDVVEGGSVIMIILSKTYPLFSAIKPRPFGIFTNQLIGWFIYAKNGIGFVSAPAGNMQ